METVLVVSDNIFGFSANVICGELEKYGFTIKRASFNDENINQYIEESVVILTILSDDFDIKQSVFIAGFKKKCSDYKRKIIIYGSDEKVKAMRTIFTDDMIAEELVRPIENDVLFERIVFVLSGGDRRDRFKHVLVVDDSGPMLRTIMGWLERKYRVSLANSAANARGVIDRDMPDLILLDYEMPICSGPQFLKRLREDDKTKDIPVIFLTGQSDSDSVKAVLDLKPQGYILKTLPESKVVEKIDEFFSR